MASSLISGAVAIILILITGYVISTGLLVVSETVVITQTEMSSIQENIRQTVISLNSSTVTQSGTYDMEIQIANNGSVSFGGSDYSKMDLFIYDGSTMEKYSISTSYSLKNDLMNKGIWDPSEIIVITKTGLGNKPLWAKVALPNGVAISTNLPEPT